jgi:hypothetical protein
MWRNFSAEFQETVDRPEPNFNSLLESIGAPRLLGHVTVIETKAFRITAEGIGDLWFK